MPKKYSDNEIKESLKEIVGEEFVDDAMDIVEKTLEWYGGFSTSKAFDNLSSQLKDLSEEVVVDFLGLTFYNQKITPDKWSEKVLKNYCFDTLPGVKFQKTEEYFKAVSPILFSFFKYLDQNNLLPTAKKLSEKVQKMETDFIESYKMINSPAEEDRDNGYLDSEEILDEVYEWFLAFEKSDYYQKLKVDEQELAEEITLNFTDFMFGFHHTVPEEWDEEILEDCCVNTLPKVLPSGEKVFKAIYPVLANFFAFLNDVKIIQNGTALAKRLKKIEGKMLKNASNPSFWDKEKLIVMKAVEAGVDPKNKKLMKKFIEKFTSQEEKPKETVKNSQPKIGRNDPCPCGSGKKYKKCHGLISEN